MVRKGTLTNNPSNAKIDRFEEMARKLMDTKPCSWGKGLGDALPSGWERTGQNGSNLRNLSYTTGFPRILTSPFSNKRIVETNCRKMENSKPNCSPCLNKPGSN